MLPLGTRTECDGNTPCDRVSGSRGPGSLGSAAPRGDG